MPGCPPTTSRRVLRVLERTPWHGTEERRRRAADGRGEVLEPDVRDDDAPRMTPPGRHEQPDLRRVERDRELGSDRRVGHLSGRCVDTRRNVDGNDRGQGPVHPSDQLGSLGSRRAAEPRAEERVDDHVVSVEIVGVLVGGVPCLPKHAGGHASVTAVRTATADAGE
jgi:hypothetical protein